MTASKTGDLARAVDLIMQPLLLEVLVAIDDGKAIEDVLPVDTDLLVVEAALQRLVTIGAVELSPVGPFSRHALTERGARLVRLLEDLDGVVPRTRSHRGAKPPRTPRRRIRRRQAHR